MWLHLERPLLGTWPATQAGALTGNQTGYPLVRRPALNPMTHASQGYIVFVFVICLPSFGVSVMDASNGVGKCALLFCFLKEIARVWWSFFIQCLKAFTEEPAGPGAFFLCRLLNTNSASLMNVD